MKKVLYLCAVLLLLSAAVSAQQKPGDRILRHRVAEGFRDGNITRFEKHRIQQDVVRYKMVERNARRDGVVSPHERRRIHAMKAKTCRDAFRFKHNPGRRVI